MSIVKLLKLIQEDKPNIAERLPKSKLKEIGDDAVASYKKDDNSRADWVQKHEKILKLALQVAEKKQFPWPNAANVKYPLLTTASISFASRVYPEII